MKVTKEFRVYEVDVYDSLRLVVDELEQQGYLPVTIHYQGAEDRHAVWSAEVYDAE